MSIIDIAARKAAEVGEGRSDYTIVDGLAVCTVCGEPRQTKQDFGNGERVVWCSCSCMAEKTPTASRERIEQLQKRGGVKPEYTFDRAQNSRELAICKRYADRFEEAAEKGAGLLLWGDVGTGKTFAAHAVANELIKKEIPVFVTSLSRVINAGIDKTDVMERIKKPSLVVFDDLGTERTSEYAREMVYLMIDERYRTGKPMIITTNLNDKEFTGALDVDRKRIYDRILERCVPLLFTGGSKRSQKAAEMKDFMKKLMEDI